MPTHLRECVGCSDGESTDKERWKDEGGRREMLEGSRSLELNINPWWFICCGSLQAPSAHRQLLAPVSWPWTWMWKAGLLPSVPWHHLPWLGETLHGPGQVLNLALIISERACMCAFYGLLFILYNRNRRSSCQLVQPPPCVTPAEANEAWQWGGLSSTDASGMERWAVRQYLKSYFIAQ